ncbi:MAG: hypothetical protein JXB88_08115 [Spirochaetales bacterium]|nr:hypothetical protein [Spirochaetales bacterium]
MIKNHTLPLFIWGFLSALICGLFSGIFLLFLLALPGVIIACLILISKDVTKKYSFFILFIALFSTACSYFYHFLIGDYFSVWEFIHVCGACGLSGYGILLFIHVREYEKGIHDEVVLFNTLKITVASGIIIFVSGIWWLIIIVYYYARFLYWPFFWIITFLCCVCCLGAGIFSFLLVRNMKKIVPLLVSGNTGPLFPLFRYVLLKRFPGILFITSGILCMVYQTGLFPLFGF